MRRFPIAREVAAALTLSLTLLVVTSCKNSPDNTAPSGDVSANSGPSTVAPISTAAFDAPLKKDGPITIQVVTNGISPFWDSMGKGIEQEKAVLGATATWGAPNGTDNTAQKQKFDDAISADVNGLAVSPIEADAFAPEIDAAIAKKIPVLTFDSDSPKSHRLAYIGTNNFAAGQQCGKFALTLFPNGGKLVAFVGNMSAQNARDRYNGFMDAVKGSKITMLQDPFEDNKDPNKAQQNVADAITKYGSQLNGLLGLYSYNGPAIVRQVSKSGIRANVKVLCFDGEPQTQQGLLNGQIDVTVVQKPFQFGRLAVELLYQANRLGFKAALDSMKPELDKLGMKLDPATNSIDTGVTVVTPATAKPFIDEMRKLGLQST